MSHRHLWLAPLAVLLSSPALAEDPPPAASSPMEDAELEALLQGAETTDLSESMFALELQADQTVTSTTKREQYVTVAPSVVTVISKDEIQSRGYASLAEVLRTVPGFYDVYDGVSHNIGIRGINGGNRASGNVLKLMIDGQAVSFRPSTGNQFGEELVPLAAIERVEIIRGPASALYGANAFLGVINVITRSGKSVQGGLLTSHLGTNGKLGGGGGLVAGFGGENGELLLTAGAEFLDRSGMRLPDTSPALEDVTARRRLSAKTGTDMSRPKSALAKASYGKPTGWGRATAWASVQGTDTIGAFQSTAPLSTRTRISTLSQQYRLTYELEPHEQLALKASGGYFDARPTRQERFDVGQPRSLLLRSVSASGFELGLEARAYLGNALDLTAGADFINEDHLLQSYDTLLLEDSVEGPAGTIIPSRGKGERALLRSVGAFAQAIYQATPSLGLTGGVRLESHNVYGANFCPRVGLVYAPLAKSYYVKLLGGTSFKAPSAEQLYTEPMEPLDLLGNQYLTSQTARTAELAGGWVIDDAAELTANLFATQVLGRVEFIQRGLYVTAANAADQTFAGGELDGRFRIVDGLNARLGVGVATKVHDSADDSVLVGPRAEQPLFPPVQAHLILDLRLPVLPLRLSPEVSFVGPRGASQSNVLENNDSYDLPPYVYGAVSLTMAEQHLWRDRPTKFSLRATNIFNTYRSEPGFGGIDIPVQGPSVFLTVIQGL